MDWLFSVAFMFTGHYGASLILLSLFINLVLLPLYHITEKWQETERQVQSRLELKLQEFRQAFRGEERFLMIQTLYRQAGYHPIYALRASVGFLFQVPFFIAAYQFLSHHPALEGVSFFVFQDLSQPDRLLWGINLLPLVMTCLNVLSSVIYSQKLSISHKIQGWLIALFFLVVLYNSPSALLIYWTFNNIFSLMKNGAYARWSSKHSKEICQEELLSISLPAPLSTFSDKRTVLNQVRRTTLPWWWRIFDSVYFLAFLVGVLPLSFYYSNNWFMFNSIYALYGLVTFSLIIFLVLSVYHLGLTWFVKKLSVRNSARMSQSLFVFGATIVLGYLLRHSFSGLFEENVYWVPFFQGLMATFLAWRLPMVDIFRVNVVLGILCLFHFGQGLYASNGGIFDEASNHFVGKGKDEARHVVYAQVQFIKTPNVYYIVPDGYPNEEALRTIFTLDKPELFPQLESWQFTLYPEALSNYRSTLSSISSSFGMMHHFYQGSLGNFEMVYSREFIVSQQNPVVGIFKNNGYQAHFIHADGFLFTRGCWVDECSPRAYFTEFIDILLPSRMQAIPIFRKILEPFRNEILQRVFSHIERIAKDDAPYFTYIHLENPNHSPTNHQTRKELKAFRQDYLKRINNANDEITQIVQRILIEDSNAVIIINSDHGAWGYGAFKLFNKEVFEGLSDRVITLDHLGVLLAIRWPEDAPVFSRRIQSNVNLFRYVFAYLSGNAEILATQVPDHGYLTKGQGQGSLLVQGVHDGEILENMVERGPVK